MAKITTVETLQVDLKPKVKRTDAVQSFELSDAITDLGHDVYQIDTRMAGYDGITLIAFMMSELIQPGPLLR